MASETVEYLVSEGEYFRHKGWSHPFEKWSGGKWELYRHPENLFVKGKKLTPENVEKMLGKAAVSSE